jgi:predicted SAM-dependent methyltransferase
MTKILDIGCGLHKVHKDAVGMDISKVPGVDIVHDLEKFPYPFNDKTFDEVHANMVLEHLLNFSGAMKEVHRLLKKDGTFHIKVPFYTSTAAFQDYTHRNFFTEKTFSYFTNTNELSYYNDFRFEILSQRLVANSNSAWERLRNLIPFRTLLKFVLLNMYDEIHVILKKA